MSSRGLQSYSNNPSKNCAVFFKLALDLQLNHDWQSMTSMCDLQAAHTKFAQRGLNCWMRT